MTISQTNPQRFQHEPAVSADPFGPIIRIGGDRLLEAVVRLLAVGGEADPVRAERFIGFSRSNEVHLDALWSRLDEQGRIVHSVLVVPNAGRTAMVFATKPQRKRDIAVIGGLIDFACKSIGTEGVLLAQALLEPSESLERQTFLSGGFEELARLSYLERPLPRRPRKLSINWPEGVSVEPYRDELEPEMLAILDASYEETLDCPALRGLRETRDILAGHRATGMFEHSLWTILRVDEQPAGVILLNPTPHHKSVELVYIGLAKWARGRGLGRLLLRHGLSLLCGRKESVISLAVDERNGPALALYHGEGFRRVLRRTAMIRAASKSQPDPACDPTSG